jgi:hypothetical protein
MMDHITKAYVHIDKPLGGARPCLKEYRISMAADLVISNRTLNYCKSTGALHSRCSMTGGSRSTKWGEHAMVQIVSAFFLLSQI